ncbi:hypothetical protein PENSPDRAFT_669360 [Peniophora sp. CONT]|nr:hypothetical protein PENSPDRAFT_669360 [Peniophora sp. CONT]
MDSLGLAHFHVCACLQDLLSNIAAAKQRRLYFQPRKRLYKALRVPMQMNAIDCGLFLIHYAQVFMADPAGCIAASIHGRDEEFFCDEAPIAHLREELQRKVRSLHAAEALV